MMKKMIFAVLASLLAGGLWAAWDDVLVRYSTPGVDRYVDGTAVADGECYALVYTREGAQFAGFNRDGSIFNPQDSELVLAAPSARDGACRPTLFQVPKDYANARKDGTWQVCLLDTRGADGLPTGLDAEGNPRRVNRFSLPDAALDISAGGVRAPALTGVSPEPEVEPEPPSAALSATERAPLPKGAPRPRISGIAVADGVVTLAVEGTVPYVTYGVDGGETPAVLDRASELAPKDGKAGGTIEIEADGASPVRFFKVVEAL